VDQILFNALNALSSIINRSSFEARRLVLNLAAIFRYLLQGDRAIILCRQELRIVEASLQMDSSRLGNRLETELAVTPSACET
jgi:LytS/YehU family sensor histidine kinase